MAELVGEKLEIGGREFVVPPINLKTARLVSRFLRSLKEGMGDDAAVEAIVAIFRAALARNYAALTDDEIEVVLSGTQVGLLDQLKALLRACGYLGASSGEAESR